MPKEEKNNQHKTLSDHDIVNNEAKFEKIKIYALIITIILVVIFSIDWKCGRNSSLSSKSKSSSYSRNIDVCVYSTLKSFKNNYHNDYKCDHCGRELSTLNRTKKTINGKKFEWHNDCIENLLKDCAKF